MRVVHVTPYFPPAFCYGGPPRSVLGLCKALQRMGVEVQVLTTTANGTSELPATAIEPLSYDDVPVRYLRRAFPRRFFGVKRLAPALREILKPGTLLHVHGLWNLTAWRASSVARTLACPYVISTRGMADGGSMAHHAARKRLAFHLVERKNLTGASLLHATSDSEASALTRLGIRTRVTVIPNGVEVPEGLDRKSGVFRRSSGIAPVTPLVAFVGRIHPIKRLDLLADAFARVRDHLRDAVLIIAGPDDEGFRGVVEPCFAPVADAVRWVGEVDEGRKWDLLADADVVVMCSDSESFGTTIAEAMAAGAPVVATHTCPWQHLETVGGGYWVPQRSEALAAAIVRVLINKSEADAMGARGARFARDRYSWTEVAHAMVREYEAVGLGWPFVRNRHT